MVQKTEGTAQKECQPQDCAKHGGRAFNMQSEPSICVLVVVQISDHLLLVMMAEDCVHDAGHVQSDDQTWHQEHGTSVVARPMPVLRLQSLVEEHSSSGRLLALGTRRLRALLHLRRIYLCSAFRGGLHSEELVGAVFLLMAEVRESILQAFDLRYLLWRGCIHVLPSLSASVIV